MSAYITWMMAIQFGIFIMGSGALATWITFSRKRPEKIAISEDQ